MSQEPLSESNRGIIVSCIVTLLSVLLSEFLPDRAVQLVFVLLLIFAVILHFKGLEGNRIYRYASYVLGFCLVAMLVVFSFVPDLLQRMMVWDVPDSSESTEDPVSPKDTLLAKQDELALALAGLQSQVNETVSGVTGLTGAVEAENLLSSKASADEVQVLLDKLAEDAEVISKSFPDIHSDRDDVMMCYKMRLYEQVCHYSSFLQAFQEYGIDCDALNIDQFTLIRWDVQNLFAIYSMKQAIEEDLLENPFYPSKGLKFNDHRVSMNEYSDVFDYEGWGFTLENTTAQEYEEFLNGKIMSFYSRFHLNFSM